LHTVYALSIDTKIDDLGLYKFEFSENFGISQMSGATTAKRMKIDQCIASDNVVSMSNWSNFWLSRRAVCQRQLGFLVHNSNNAFDSDSLHTNIMFSIHFLVGSVKEVN